MSKKVGVIKNYKKDQEEQRYAELGMCKDTCSSIVHDGSFVPDSPRYTMKLK